MCTHGKTRSIYVANNRKHARWQTKPRDGFAEIKQCINCQAILMECPTCPPEKREILEFRQFKLRKMFHLNDCLNCPKKNSQQNKRVLCQHCKVILFLFQILFFRLHSKTIGTHARLKAMFNFIAPSSPHAFRLKQDCPLVSC